LIIDLSRALLPISHRALLFLLALAAGPGAVAQSRSRKPRPFSVWLDFHRMARPGAAPPALPIWLAKVTTAQQTTRMARQRAPRFASKCAPSGISIKAPAAPVFRRRARASPTVVGRDANGEQKFLRGPFGQGLDLPTSETVVFAVDGIDAIEIQTPGDGHNVRGAFLATLRSQTMLRALDFVANSDLIDAFGGCRSCSRARGIWRSTAG